jgi:ClpX C4-type zinc finger
VGLLDCKCPCHDAQPGIPQHLNAGCPTAETLLGAVKAAHANGLAEGRATTLPLGCSFCGKAKDAVKKLIAGYGEAPRVVYICEACVTLAYTVIVEASKP